MFVMMIGSSLIFLFNHGLFHIFPQLCYVVKDDVKIAVFVIIDLYLLKSLLIHEQFQQGKYGFVAFRA